MTRLYLLLSWLVPLLSVVDCGPVCMPPLFPGIPLPSGNIVPQNLDVVYGSNVTLTCDKHCYTGAGNSTFMGFKVWQGSVLKQTHLPGDPRLTVVNETAITLELVNVTLASKGAYTCFMLSPRTNTSTILQTVPLNNVGYPPEKARIGCVVMNYLDMKCTAELPDTLVTTSISMEYKIAYVSSYLPCPRFNTKSRSCFWFHDPPVPCQGDKPVYVGQTYDIKATAKNVFGTSTSKSRVVLKHVVKPDPVNNLRVSRRGSRNMTLAFDLHSMTFPKPHQVDVHYTSTLHSGNVSKKLSNTSKHQSILLDDLRPHMTYTVSVVIWPYDEVRHNVTGFASDPVSLEVTTLADVPETSPKLLPGSYTQTDCGMLCQSQCPVESRLCREVRVFWPKIDEEDRNGDIIGYHLRVRPKLAEPKYETAGSSQSQTLVMLKNKTYVVNITAENTAGMARTSSNMTILSTDQAAAAPTYVAAYRYGSDSQTVLVKWAVGSDNDDDGEFILYWSDNDISDRWSKPKTDVFAKTVSGVTREANITLPSESDEYWFGVARVRRSGDSSPVVVSECLYTPDNGLSPPTLTKSSTYPDNTIGVDVKALTCDDTNDVVVNYTIFYCPTDVTVEVATEAVCTGPVRSTVVNASTTEVFITNSVKADQMYLVWATTQTPSASSQKSQPIPVRVSGLTSGAIAGIVIVAVVCAILIPVGFVVLFRKCCRTVKKELEVKFEFPVENGYAINTISTYDYDLSPSSLTEDTVNAAGKTKDEIHLQVVSEPSSSGVQSVSSGSMNYSKLALANMADASQEGLTGHAGQQVHAGQQGQRLGLPSIGEEDVDSSGSSGGYDYKKLAVNVVPVAMDMSAGSLGDSSEEYQRVRPLVGSSDQGMGSSADTDSSGVPSYSKVRLGNGVPNGVLKNGLVHTAVDFQAADSESEESGESGSSVTPILA